MNSAHSGPDTGEQCARKVVAQFIDTCNAGPLGNEWAECSAQATSVASMCEFSFGKPRTKTLRDVWREGNAQAPTVLILNTTLDETDSQHTKRCHLTMRK